MVIGMPRQQQVTVLPEALKAWRMERKLSQAGLAKMSLCSEGLIAQIETGRRQPGLVNAISIAKALGVPLRAIAVVHMDESTVASFTGAVEEPGSVGAA
jgi:transcriptional regulator with XRE-family HTH domain